MGTTIFTTKRRSSMKTLFTTAMSAILLVNNAWSIDQTTTGYYYPTGTSDLGNYAGWLATGCGTNTAYFAGEYHIGHDFEANAGDPVYPICNGVVEYVSFNGWGTGNVGVFIRHRTSNGNYFLALYGHVQTSVVVDDNVSTGDSFAEVGSWPYGDHLHFGVVPGNTLPPAPFGRINCSNWPASNSFVDPIQWITGQVPLPNDVGRMSDGSFSEEIIEAYADHGGLQTFGTPVASLVPYSDGHVTEWPWLTGCLFQIFDGGALGDSAILYDQNAGVNEAFPMHGQLWITTKPTTAPISSLAMSTSAVRLTKSATLRTNPPVTSWSSSEWL